MSQFRQSVNNIFMEKKQYKNLPKEYNFLSDNLRILSNDIYFQNLQFSDSKHGSFKSLDLIFFNNKQYQLLNTGFFLKPIGNDKLGKALLSIIPTLTNDTWKGNNVVDFDKYNPKNNLTNFSFFKHFINISEENLLADFINKSDQKRTQNTSEKSRTIYTYSVADKELDEKQKKLNLKIFVDDINKANKIKIDLAKVENKPLENLCQQIKIQMPNSDCTFAAYKAYFEDKDEEITRIKMDRFFWQTSQVDISSITNEFLLPRGDIEFGEDELQMNLPNDLFYKNDKNDSSAISFNLNKIEHQLTYDFDKNIYVFKVKVFPYPNSMSSDLKFIGEYRDVFKRQDFTKEINVNKNTLKNIEFLIYPDKINVQLVVNLDGNDVNYKLEKALILNKGISKK